MEQTIRAVIQNLKYLFAEKSSLNGFSDWDTFIGCIVALENVANALQQPQEEITEGE